MTPTASSRAARQLGRLGGLANTEAQQRARQKNAQRAGRPRRVCIYCGEPVKGGHADPKRDKTCGAHGWCWHRRFADPRPAAHLDATLFTDLLRLLQAEPDRFKPMIRRVQRAIDIGR